MLFTGHGVQTDEDTDKDANPFLPPLGSEIARFIRDFGLNRLASTTASPLRYPCVSSTVLVFIIFCRLPSASASSPMVGEMVSLLQFARLSETNKFQASDHHERNPNPWYSPSSTPTISSVLQSTGRITLWPRPRS